MKIFYYNKAKNHTQNDTDQLIKESLNGYLGKEISVQIKRTSAGKPYLPGYPLHIGVTHTDDIVLIAISEKPFGIDCESIDRTVSNHARIAEKYFSGNEKAYVFDKDKFEAVRTLIEDYALEKA